jgi:hypothetical protein
MSFLTHMLLLMLVAATCGNIAGRIARHFDHRRGDTVISKALASGGISLLFV